MNPNFPERLLEGEKQFQLLADFVPQLMWLANPDGWIYWYNKRCYDYSGTTAEQIAGWGWQVVIDPDALPAVMEGWTRAIENREPFEMVFPLKAADGSFHPFLSRVQPLKDDQGRVLRWFGTNTDISEQKRVEERLQLLLNELNHRVKNTLSTVSAIASLSLRELPRENIATFHDRLVALSRAHDLLTQRNWEATDLREIVRQSLAPLCAMWPDDRLAIEGPAVLIPADRAASWSMALHELCTNALKHGAFKTEAGHVSIEWGAPERGRLHFRWSEHGGPPVTAPRRRGFVTGQATQHQAGHRQVDQDLARVRQVLIILAQPTVLSQSPVLPGQVLHKVGTLSWFVNIVSRRTGNATLLLPRSPCLATDLPYNGKILVSSGQFAWVVGP
jgi:PAS domain S-box-containing protein